MRRPWIDSSPTSRASAIVAPLTWLITLSIAIVAPAVFLARRYPLAPNARDLTDLGILSDYTHESFWVFVTMLLVWFAAYAAGIVVARRCDQRAALIIILVSAAVAGLFLVSLYPVNATDMHMYAARSRLFTAYGVDPIAIPPAAYPADPWRSLVSAEWSDKTSPYGPLWTLIAAPITLLAGDNLLRALLGFKLLALNCYLATGWLIAKGLAGQPKARPAAAALAFLWNPLVLWEGVGNGHNDTVVALLLVVAIVVWLRGRLVWVIPTLVAATLLKYVAVILLPLAVVAVARRAHSTGALARTLTLAAFASVVIVLAGLAPFYDIAAIRESVTSQGAIYTTSPAAVAIRQLQEHVNAQSALHAAEAVGLLALATATIFWLRRLSAEPSRLPRAAFEVMFVFLLVATMNFRSWYLIWLVALAAISGSSWAVARAAAWSAGAMATYPLFIWIWGWERFTFQRVEAIAVALTFVPPLAVTLAQIGQSRGWFMRPERVDSSGSCDTATGPPR